MHKPEKEKSMKIVYMGSPGYATSPLEKLVDLDHEIVGVYTQPDRPAGRGKGREADAARGVLRETVRLIASWLRS